MRLKPDENVGRTTKRLLQARGHDVDDVHDEDLAGAPDVAPDVDVWEAVCDTGRFFVALDTDFADARRFPPGTHPGLLLLRPQRNASRATAAPVQRVVRECDITDVRGCLVVARTGNVRVFWPPA